MQNFLLAVDRLSTWIGKAFAWSIVGLTLLISWEVFSRYVLNKPHAWMLDAQIMLYGTLFMTAGAYTLAARATLVLLLRELDLLARGLSRARPRSSASCLVSRIVTGMPALRKFIEMPPPLSSHQCE